jgi:hypothetical protein
MVLGRHPTQRAASAAASLWLKSNNKIIELPAAFCFGASPARVLQAFASFEN